MATVTLVPPRARGELTLPAIHVVLDAGHPRPGARHLLRDVERVVIGRGAEPPRRAGTTLYLELPDRHLSGEHCAIERGLGGWTIRDLGSKNGLSVEGERTAHRVLDDGDWIELGETLLRFRVVQVERFAPDDAIAEPGGSLVPGVEVALRRLADAAASNVPVLLLGPSGVGKHDAARLVHARSGRRGRFIVVRCAGLGDQLASATLFGDSDGPGAFAAAHGGTLLLDDVADLPLATQGALLRVLQEREVVPVGSTRAQAIDVRVVAATLRDLEREVEAARFRVDLYAQLAGLRVALPPLRERLEDLGTLVASALARHSPDRLLGLQPSAAWALCRHRWPRNLRELDHAIAAAVAVTHDDRLGGELVEQIGTSLAPSAAELVAARRDELVALLREHHGNLAAVARALATSRAQVHRLLRRFELDPDAYRR
jgi:transcriptional regulator of acetoin/glycerol metabolism|nr:sigma 54-interacting transcriptional regulator [Kofleriaceae bacterium]